MGKISDALEKRQKEKQIKTDKLPLGKPEEAEKYHSTSPLTAQPIMLSEFSSKLVVISAPESVEAEHFKALRTHILFPRNGERPRTIMVTSAFPGEGKTFVSANLAASLAMGINEYVLLVDCDFRNPSIHNMFACSNANGLRECLDGQKDLSDLIIRTRIKKLSLLTAGSTPSNPAELLGSAKMNEFLKETRERYDDRFIILDVTPSEVTAEANALANYVDGIIFVVRAQKSPREVIQRSIENLGRKKILGIVFNGYRTRFRDYGKYYHY